MTSAMTSQDLIPDEPLDRMVSGYIPDSLDTLNHRHIAKRLAELAQTSQGHVNIALYGPWGSGKSSFYGLLKRELEQGSDSPICLSFDAWKHAGEGFQTNFLYELAANVPGSHDRITDKLFRSSKTVNLPFGLSLRGKNGLSHWRWLLPSVLVLLFIVAPTAWAALLNIGQPVDKFLPLAAANIAAWAGFAASGTLVLVASTLLLDLTKVTVQETSPSFLVQFGAIFDSLVSSAKDRRFVIFVDELDRCGPKDVMQTLEGLRTFLGHDRCTFVVAFDRDAVSNTIAHHLKNDVPMRPNRPYYSTSSEYLDKIFQFQVSLPPQSNQTFRRYALSLVSGKEGVWGDIRDHDSQGLEEVVSILSPRHVVSPRRTKVLLNNFAVNVRIFESLGFNVIKRASEIAVYTVFQSEFPKFWADLQDHPDLVRFMASRTPPAREKLRLVWDRYSESSTALVDDIVVPAISEDSAADSSEGTEAAEAVASTLDANLDSFLRRITEMGVVLPSADLILMHSGGNLLSFEDSVVYNAVLGAADSARSETLAVIREASQRDQVQAARLIAEMVAGETRAEADSLTSLVGELVAELEPADRSTLRPITDQLWSRIRLSHEESIARFSPNSLRGFALTITARPSSQPLSGFVNIVLRNNRQALAAVFAAALERQDAVLFSADGAELAEIAVQNVRTDPSLLAQLLVTSDALELAALTDGHITQFVSSYAVSKPTTVEPESATVAATAAAEVLNSEAKAAYDLKLTEVASDLASLLDVWESLIPGQSARNWLVMAVAHVARDHRAIYDLLMDRIDRDKERGLDEPVNREILGLAISEAPFVFRSEWVSRLSSVPSNSGEQVLEAYRTFVQEAVTDTYTNERQLKSAVDASNVASIPRDDLGTPLADIVADLSNAASRVKPSFTRSYLEIQTELFRGLRLVVEDATFDDAISDAHAEAFIRAFSEFVAGDDVIFYLQAIGLLDSTTLGSLRKKLGELRPVATDKASVFAHAVLAVDSRVLANGDAVVPIAVEDMALALAQTRSESLIHAWVATAPRFDELRLTLTDPELKAVPIDYWSSFSKHSSADDRSAAWMELDRLGSPNGSKSAVAHHGVRDALYQDLADQIVNGSSATSRTRAFERFRTLQQANSAARDQALNVAMKLISDRRKADASIVTMILEDNAPAFSSAQKKSIASELTPWLEYAGNAVSGVVRKRLIHAGLAIKPQSGLKGAIGRVLNL